MATASLVDFLTDLILVLDVKALLLSQPRPRVTRLVRRILVGVHLVRPAVVFHRGAAEERATKMERPAAGGASGARARGAPAQRRVGGERGARAARA